MSAFSAGVANEQRNRRTSFPRQQEYDGQNNVLQYQEEGMTLRLLRSKGDAGNA
jgi:hypothetical protein